MQTGEILLISALVCSVYLFFRSCYLDMYYLEHGEKTEDEKRVIVDCYGHCDEIRVYHKYTIENRHRWVLMYVDHS